MSMNIMNLAVSDAGKKGHCDECGEIPKDPFFIFGFLLFFLLCYAYFFLSFSSLYHSQLLCPLK